MYSHPVLSMRSGIENWLLRQWYGSNQPPWFLRVLEPVYRAAYRRTQKSDVSERDSGQSVTPLVIVGNITAGGSGKTPLVISLCRLALALNFKPGIASTGYGRHSRETLVAHADGDAGQCGDEPVLLAKRTGVTVVVAAHRRDAVKRLQRMDVDLIISDDGLQQADLERDMEICVVDGARGIGNGHLLPAGPLREPPDRLWRVDQLVTNGEWAGKPAGLKASTMTLRGSRLCSLNDDMSCSVDEFLNIHRGKPIHAVAGIGNPERFFITLGELGLAVNPHRFADHYYYKRQDFESMPEHAVIIMTEKDAVKCRGLGLQNAWYLPVDAILPNEFEDWFKKRIVKLTKERK